MKVVLPAYVYPYKEKSNIILKCFLVTLSMLLFSTLFFYLRYYYTFKDLAWSQLFKIYAGSLYFDLSSIAIINILFVVIFCLPFTGRLERWQMFVAGIAFLVMNLVGFFFNMFDVIFFAYTRKRVTSDIFAFTGSNDKVSNLVPVFLIDYWYIVVILLLALFFVSRFTWKKIFLYKSKVTGRTDWLLGSAFCLVFWTSVLVFGVNGGSVREPLTIIDAAKFASSNNIPLVLNSPFTLAKTFNSDNLLPDMNFYNEQVAEKIYSPYHQNAPAQFQKKNVVFIVLESFSKEFVGSFTHEKSYTPFLDSLSAHSLIFTNAFANGKHSIQGIPAVTSSIPSTMNGFFTHSVYGNDDYKGLAQLLDDEGYYTAFFHGGENGSFNFDSYARKAGYEDYFGKNEYDNNKNYDGNWGIWDEPFLQYMANKMNDFRQPFFSTVFTVSSHNPYALPAAYKNVYTDKGNPLKKCVRYTDHALEEFFNSIKNKPWFNNTIFVITADHTGISDHPFYANLVGQYEIPVMMYDPSNKLAAGVNTNTLAQVDIMPTILRILGYSKPYFAFGNDNAYEGKESFAVYTSDDFYYMVAGDFILGFDGKTASSLYNYKTDPFLKNNILHTTDDVVSKQMEPKLKAYLQVYTNSLKKNNMLVKR